MCEILFYFPLVLPFIMVFLTLSKQVTGLIGPALFRNGVRARNFLLRGGGRGAIAPGQRSSMIASPSLSSSSSYYLDLLCLIPYAQKLISLTVYDKSQKAVSAHYSSQSSSSDSRIESTYNALFGNVTPTTPTNDDGDDKTTVSELRVRVLDENLRPALLPNDRWSDVAYWKWNLRILKWARMEFLVSKYGPDVKEALDAYPQLRASPQLSRHPTQRILLDLARGRINLSSSTDDNGDETTEKKDNNNNDRKHKKKTMLPSSQTLLKAFGMKSWTKKKDSTRFQQTVANSAQRLIRGDNDTETEKEAKAEEGAVAITQIPDTTDLCDAPLEDILEVATGGHVVHCGPFNTVCEEADIYQMWTQEYVEQLGIYLMDRSSSHNGASGGKETLVIDVGAGDGLLIHFLKDFCLARKKQQEKQPKDARTNNSNNYRSTMPTFIATDDGSWGIFAKADVEKLNVHDTLSKYVMHKEEGDNREVIILCSWMPMGVDWSKLFRDANVDEYILIGEADDGSCGHNWETWGNAAFASQESTNSRPPAAMPPYQMNGYQRWDMDILSQFQFSRFDNAVSRSSKTVSFRKP